MMSVSEGDSQGPSVAMKSLMAGLNATRKLCKHSGGRSLGDIALRFFNTEEKNGKSVISSDFTLGTTSTPLSLCCEYRWDG